MYQRMGPLKTGLRRSLPFAAVIAPVHNQLSRFLYIDYKMGLFDKELAQLSKKK
jgi:hypothetical protein